MRKRSRRSREVILREIAECEARISRTENPSHGFEDSYRVRARIREDLRRDRGELLRLKTELKQLDDGRCPN